MERLVLRWGINLVCDETKRHVSFVATVLEEGDLLQGDSGTFAV